MTPQEALKLLDNNIALINSDRKSHEILKTAVDTIQKAIQPQPVQIEQVIPPQQ